MRSIVRRVHPDLFSDYPRERSQNSESLMVGLQPSLSSFSCFASALRQLGDCSNMKTCTSRINYTAPQLLNDYVAKLTRGEHINATTVTFWVREEGSLSRINADLPAYGSLGPIFQSFGLISAEELRDGSGAYIPSEPQNFSPHRGKPYLDALSMIVSALCKSHCHRDALSLLAGPSDTDFMDWLRSTLTDALRASSQHESLKKVVRGLRASIEGRFCLAGVQVWEPILHIRSCSS